MFHRGVERGGGGGGGGGGRGVHISSIVNEAIRTKSFF